MAAEIMRGFGAVPKRGAEVGGMLLGTIEAGRSTIVRIEDFDPVRCSYTRGPSYLLTDADGRPSPMPAGVGTEFRRGAYAVGYFRSHTRDGLIL